MRLVTLFFCSLALGLAGPGDLKYIELNGMKCGPEGTAKSPKGKALNRLKNRYELPGEEALDPDVSLPALLAPGYDVGRFDEKKAARVRGYVVRVLVGGDKESCNCGATDPDERDTHIELALAKGAPPTQRVIVEVTPRIRKLKGAGWTTKQLRKEFEGKWVEVTGWVMFDWMHVKQAENTNPGHKGNFRATCWELHPVTAIEPLPAPPAAAPAFDPAALTALQRLHAAHLGRHPKGKASLEKRNDGHLSGFDKDELKEAEAEAAERRPKK
jgi:hypothetical protein